MELATTLAVIGAAVQIGKFLREVAVTFNEGQPAAVVRTHILEGLEGSIRALENLEEKGLLDDKGLEMLAEAKLMLARLSVEPEVTNSAIDSVLILAGNILDRIKDTDYKAAEARAQAAVNTVSAKIKKGTAGEKINSGKTTGTEGGDSIQTESTNEGDSDAVLP